MLNSCKLCNASRLHIRFVLPKCSQMTSYSWWCHATRIGSCSRSHVHTDAFFNLPPPSHILAPDGNFLSPQIQEVQGGKKNVVWRRRSWRYKPPYCGEKKLAAAPSTGLRMWGWQVKLTATAVRMLQYQSDVTQSFSSLRGIQPLPILVPNTHGVRHIKRPVDKNKVKITLP